MTTSWARPVTVRTEGGRCRCSMPPETDVARQASGETHGRERVVRLAWFPTSADDAIVCKATMRASGHTNKPPVASLLSLFKEGDGAGVPLVDDDSVFHGPRRGDRTRDNLFCLPHEKRRRMRPAQKVSATGAEFVLRRGTHRRPRVMPPVAAPRWHVASHPRPGPLVGARLLHVACHLRPHPRSEQPPRARRPAPRPRAPHCATVGPSGPSGQPPRADRAPDFRPAPV